MLVVMSVAPVIAKHCTSLLLCGRGRQYCVHDWEANPIPHVNGCQRSTLIRSLSQTTTCTLHLWLNVKTIYLNPLGPIVLIGMCVTLDYAHTSAAIYGV